MNEAITAFNFVPLSFLRAGVDVRSNIHADRYHADLYTGWFELSLTSLTPLYTRAALGVENFVSPVGYGNDKQTLSADFFHRGDAERTPVLPGSSLRGMFRSIFEIMTRSKMEFVNDRRLFYRTFASSKRELRDLYNTSFQKPNLIAGIVRKNRDEWFLEVSNTVDKGFVVVPFVQVRQYRRTPFTNVAVKVEPTQTVHRQIGAYTADLVRQGHTSGYLIFPGDDVNRRSWFQVILEPESRSATVYRIDEAIYEDYLAWGKMAHGHKFGSQDAPPLLKEGSPAFALLNESKQVMVIGANMMMALRYERSIKDVVRQSYGPNAHVPDIDMTEAVFGRVVDKDPKATKSIKSRVFFEDALCTTPQPWLANKEADSLRVPEIMSGPKPTAIQLYLQQSDNPNARLIHWSSPDAKISGHKRYWHRPVDAVKEALHPNLPALSTCPHNRGLEFT